MRIPRYRELPIDPSYPPRSAWGVWGPDDQIGTLNLVGPEQSRRAAGCVRRGAVFPMNLPIEQPDPPLFGREPIRHELIRNSAGFDDRVDSLFPQGSSQWDSLSHAEHPEHGFYNGATVADLHGGIGTRNGIDRFAQKGLVARGVLLDLARSGERRGLPVDGGAFREFTVDDLEVARREAGVEYEQGDVLMIRTGWLGWYAAASAQQKEEIASDSFTRLQAPGISGGEDMAEYLWDAHVAAVVADSPSIEAWPHRFVVDGYLHFRLIPLLGMSLGEMWDLDALAADCAADGVHECMVTSAPLNLRGGVGSPANALAVK